MFNPEQEVILIVDDNPTNLSVLSQVLKADGYKTRFAMDGASAVEQAQLDPPGLILLDVQMPGMDGFEACTLLKANLKTTDIPVIFITAATNVESKVKGLSIGAVDYITKPFQHEEVLARVKVHLQMRYLTRKVQEQSLTLLAVNQELQRLANLDGLTGVANRRRFDEYLLQQWNCLARERRDLSLILCDIDYFKGYNDYYGHQAGDTCLIEVAKAIKNTLKRPADLITRYGGEEFAVVLPNTHPDGAHQVAELIRENVKCLKIAHEGSQISQYITLSLGVSSQIPIAGMSMERLIADADKALYISKKEGRDQSHLICNAQQHSNPPMMSLDSESLLSL